MRKVFITGDAGMLGNAISEMLKDSGEYKVMEFPMYEHYTNEFHFFKGKQVKKAEVDITKEHSLNFIFDKLDSDSIVINCAAYVNTDKCENFSYEAVMSNVIGTQNIIKQCQRINCTLIHFSTTAVFDPDFYMNYEPVGQFNETAKILPKTIYGATKYASELAVKQSLEKFVIIKPVFIHGNFPYDNSSNIMRILKAVKFDEKEKVDITLSDEYKKNYMYIDYFKQMMFQIIENVDDCLKQDFIISKDPVYAKTFDLWLKEIAYAINEPLSKVKSKINQIPEADYLKDHLGTSDNFYQKFPNFKFGKYVNEYKVNIFEAYCSIK